MRIGIEAQRLFREKKFGVEIVALELIRHLQALDKENEYFIFVKPGPGASSLSGTGNFSIVEIPDVPYPVWEQFYLPRYVKKYRIELLHCTANTAPVFTRARVLLTLHDVIFSEKLITKGSSYQIFGNWYRRFLLPFAIRNGRTIITVSHFEKSRILKLLSLPEQQVKVVHNAVSSDFHPVTDANYLQRITEKYRLPSVYILYFGNTAPKKNMRRMLEAYSIYRAKAGNAALTMVVTDRSEGVYTKKLLEELNLSELYQHLHIIPYVDYADLPVVYSKATVLAYPSLRESFGLPVLEAMACGTPVVSSNNSSIPEIAGDAAVLMDPENVSAIAEALYQTLQDPSLLIDLRARGLERIRQFSWQHTAEAVLNLYKEEARSITKTSSS